LYSREPAKSGKFMRLLYGYTVFHSRETGRGVVETLDLAPEEERKIARILEKLRDEATASA